jgi:hypothetical protein
LFLYFSDLPDDVPVPVNGDGDPVRQMQDMAKIGHLLAAEKAALSVFPGKMMIADDLGRIGKRGKAFQQPRSPKAWSCTVGGSFSISSSLSSREKAPMSCSNPASMRFFLSFSGSPRCSPSRKARYSHLLMVSCDFPADQVSRVCQANEQIVHIDLDQIGVGHWFHLLHHFTIFRQ